MSWPVISSTRRAAISDFAAAMVCPSSSTSFSKEASLAVSSPLIVVNTARTTSVTMPGSTCGCCALIAASLCFSASTPPRPCGSERSSMIQDLFDLVLQCLGIKRLHDIVGDAGRLCRNHVLCLALGGDHDEWQRLQPVIRP